MVVSTAGIGLVTSGILLVGVGAAAAAATVVNTAAASSSSSPLSSQFNNNPQALVREGMRKFERGDVEGSVEYFNAALDARPSMRPYLWQRGLSLYYVGTEAALAEGARQFRDDVSVNPNDTEEAIWAFLCEAKLQGAETARKNFLQVGRDSRPVMRAAEEAFRTGADPLLIKDAARGDTVGHAAFYSNLYVGLWHEAEGQEELAREAIVRAVGTDYARGSGDYMAALARVHVQKRGWGT